MIDHVGIAVSDYLASKRFYTAALAPLGYTVIMDLTAAQTGGYEGAGLGVAPKPDFWISKGAPQYPPVHICFSATSRAQVTAFYHAALAAGGRDNGAPGLRPHYHANYFGAFVLDLDGNNVEAVCHTPE